MLNLNERVWQTQLHRLLMQENHNISFVLMHIQQPVNTNRHLGRLKVPFRKVTPTPALPECLFSVWKSEPPAASEQKISLGSHFGNGGYPTLAPFIISPVLAFLQVCSSSSGHRLSSSWHQFYKTLVCCNAPQWKKAIVYESLIIFWLIYYLLEGQSVLSHILWCFVPWMVRIS
jgi:hypothetical protein